MGTPSFMPTIERSIQVSATPAAVYRYVSEVGNLPDYFDSMTAAERTDKDEEVHVTAVVPDGGKREGKAWFRTDDSARRIEWGSESGSDYSGWLQVEDDGDGSQVHLGLQMHYEDKDDSIERTLATLKSRIES